MENILRNAMPSISTLLYIGDEMNIFMISTNEIFGVAQHFIQICEAYIGIIDRGGTK